ncbi:SPARC-related modular calcium-binding protein 2-like [Etheostoma spectabile]|uniref:SPARC-related modular calcium-binding protein 2-like n=1 Tax=Etheostoma spectabile TaxID=54343 RepID=UPI0013AEB91F|nr:SPARC-related modular calcium-binding protein 2-like [Etheostoma spectabile]
MDVIVLHALTFTCRGLLVLLLSDWVQTDRTPSSFSRRDIESSTDQRTVYHSQTASYAAATKGLPLYIFSAVLWTVLLVFSLTQPFRLTHFCLLRRVEEKYRCTAVTPCVFLFVDSPQMCERERAFRLAQMSSPWQEERFLPECSADGRYNPVQCHADTGYCWCVRVDGGRPLPGTSARNRIPECTGAEEAPTHRRDREKPLRGCPGARKKQFLQSLVRALQLEAEHAGSLSPYQASHTPSSSSPSPSLNPPPSTTLSFSTLDVSSPAVLQAVEASGPEVVLRWHFIQLDVDSSGVLSEREARPLQQFLRQRLKPRRCAKKFAQYCDRDRDRGLTLEELKVCLGL